MNKSILLIGSGGHASVLADQVYQLRLTLKAIVAPPTSLRDSMYGLPIISNDEDVIRDYPPDTVVLINGVGSIPGNQTRIQVYEYFEKHGYEFLQVIAPSAIVSPFAKLGAGVQVMPGAVVQAGAIVGDSTIINSGAIVEHDCVIGNGCHISPGAVLCGGVRIGTRVHVGAGATVIQNIDIGNNSVIGAGAVARRNLADNETLYPAKCNVI